MGSISKEGIEESTKQWTDFVTDKAVQLHIDSVAGLLKTHYPSQDNFLALMKTK